MKNLIKIILFCSFITNLYGATVDRPSTQYKEQAKKNYKWLIKYNHILLFIELSKDVEKFISKSEVEQYFKLRLRNLVNDIKVVESSKDYSYSYCTVDIQLYKYNDKMEIYTGLIELKITPSILNNEKYENFRTTIPISGGNTQIKRFIKENIDSMVEALAQDYYFIKDLK